MRKAIISAAVGAALCITASASAQEATDRTRAFVEQVALMPSSNDRPMARWQNDICVGAVGLQPSEAQALVDRISVRARSIGLDPGAPGCRANVMVIYAPDSDSLSRQIVDQRRDLLGYYADGSAVTAGREELDDFANSQRPVRWWYVSEAGAGAMQNRPGAALDRQASGRSQAQAAAAGEGSSASNAGSGTDIQGMDAVRSNGSRTRTNLRNEMSYTLVVVDARRVAGVSAQAWMDYVAMVALAQIDPNAQTTGYDTVLNLFASPSSPPAGLSAWDDAYLKAVYRARRDSGGNRQITDVARRMDENLN